jgi:hypothetical protein
MHSGKWDTTYQRNTFAQTTVKMEALYSVETLWTHAYRTTCYPVVHFFCLLGYCTYIIHAPCAKPVLSIYFKKRITVLGIYCDLVCYTQHGWYYTGWPKVPVHLLITVQKTRKNILNSFNHNYNVQLAITDGVSVSLVSPWPWRSAAKQTDWAK